jgi:predicted nicotinamide N-methyase
MNPTASRVATSSPLIFQDVVKAQQGGDDALSLAFFELANAEIVGFRLSAVHLKRNARDWVISARQDSSASSGDHTGKIVWETSYLLLNFLLARGDKLGKILEVGAGCGLLGQVLAASKYAKKVVLTECDAVMENLERNVERNESVLAKKKDKPLAVARQLNWLSPRKDMARFPKDLQEHSFDTIVGTDVVYTPSLVEPLLSTLRIMAHDKTIVYLCLQIRCEDSHKLLLRLASEHHWKVDDISQELSSMPSCSWGLDMECKLLKLTTTDLQQTKKRKSSSTPEAAPGKHGKR